MLLNMNLLDNVLDVLDNALYLQGRASSFDKNTLLLGALPELDSMAAVGLITSLESHFGIIFQDEDISGAAFSTVGSLCDLVAETLAQQST